MQVQYRNKATSFSGTTRATGATGAALVAPGRADVGIRPAVRSARRTKPRVAILGTVGVPGGYGGFETLAQNLVDYHTSQSSGCDLAVYCSAKAFDHRPASYGSAKLRYIGLEANGAQSILYDALSLFDAARRGNDRILLLGTSGALALPLLRLFSRARIVTNLGGIEWKRDKWHGLAKTILRLSEWAAVRFSHRVIVDNDRIADYVKETYNRSCDVITYGGDHALVAEPDPAAVADLPENYALALCRIEPENNVAMILEAFSKVGMPLVFVGNWDASEYGRKLKARYRSHPTITVHDPVYEPRALRAIRDRASLYVHGHSVGGTNPALVEMMHFGIPVVAHGCSFNRRTTMGRARYFMSAEGLAATLRALTPETSARIGSEMGRIARLDYTWDRIGPAYFALLGE